MENSCCIFIWWLVVESNLKKHNLRTRSEQMANVCVFRVCVFVFVCVFVQDSEKYVEQLLTLFNRFSKLVKEAFQDDPRFLTARDKVGFSPKRCTNYQNIIWHL